MQIAVIGATGLVGAATANVLANRGHKVRRLSRSGEYRVDLRSGDGLAEALDGVEAIVNASNGPASGRAAGVLVAGTDRILAASSAHHLCVSIVGLDVLAPHSGYYRVKLDQEEHVRRAGIPFTILRATQLHEYLGRPLLVARRLRIVPRSSARFAPVAACEVGDAIADAVEAGATDSTINVTGPETLSLTEMCTWRGVGVPLPLPSGLRRVLAAGAATTSTPDIRGTVSWAAWLTDHTT